MKTVPLSLCAIAIVSLMSVCGTFRASVPDAPGEETVEPAMQQDIAETPGKYVAMATVSYASGQAAAPHKHPGSLFAYVLEGPNEPIKQARPASP